MPHKLKRLRNRLGTFIAGAPLHPEQPSAEEVATAFNQFAGGDVAEWHFPMMNDVRRNTAYETALGAALKKGGTVLEIGSGSGWLAALLGRLASSSGNWTSRQSTDISIALCAWTNRRVLLRAPSTPNIVFLLIIG